MTDTITHAREQAAESLAADIAAFDFGTNTGSALAIAPVEVRNLATPAVCRNFEERGYCSSAPLSASELNFISLSLNSSVKEVNPVSIKQEIFESSVVNERENVLEDPWMRQGPFVIETDIEPTIIKPRISNKQKAVGLGILAAVLIL